MIESEKHDFFPEYIHVSVFYLPFIKHSLSNIKENIIIDKDNILIKTDLLTKTDLNFILFNLDLDQQVFEEFEKKSRAHAKNYFVLNYRYVVNLHTYLCQYYGISFDFFPKNIKIIEEFSNVYIRFFYINNIQRDLLSINNIMEYTYDFFDFYNHFCTENFVSYKKISLNINFMYLLSLIDERIFFTQKDYINFDSLLVTLSKLWAILIFFTTYKNILSLSEDLEDFCNKCISYRVDEKKTYQFDYLCDVFSETKKIFLVDINVIDCFFFLAQNHFPENIFKELINSINYRDKIHFYLKFYNKNICSKLVWLLNNIEIEHKINDCYKGRLVRVTNYSENIVDFKKTKNYNIYYSVSQDFVKFLESKLGVSLFLIDLVWSKYFSIKNITFEKKNILMLNKFSDVRSVIDLEIFKRIFRNITITYEKMLLQFFLLKKNNMDLVILEDNVNWEFNYLNNQLINFSEIKLSKVSFDKFESDWYFNRVFDDSKIIISVLLKNFPFLTSLFTENILEKSTVINETYFDTILFKFESFFKDLVVSPTYESRCFFIMELKKILDILLERLSNKKLNLLLFFKTYDKFQIDDNPSKKTNYLASNFIFIKNNIKFLHNDSLKTENDILITINLFKNFLIRASKLYSKYYSYYYILKITYKVLNSNEVFYYSLFSDFRGRIYVEHSDKSWIGNTLLRYNVVLNLTNYLSDRKNINSFLTNYDEVKFNKILDTFNLEKKHYNLNNYLYHILTPFLLSIGCSLNSFKCFEEWFYLGLNFIKNDLIDKSFTLENYFKIQVYSSIIKDAIVYYSEENEEKLIKILTTNTIVFDSVANGYTHIIGGFKNSNKKDLEKSLFTANYYKNEKKEDLYLDIVNSIKNNLTNINKLEDKYNKAFKNNEHISWEIISQAYIQSSSIHLTRTCIKNPVMTSFYGSKFLTWREKILENLKNNSTLISYLIEQNIELSIEEQLKKFSWITASLLSIEFHNREFFKHTTDIAKRLKTINIELIEDIYISINDIKISVMYKEDKVHKKIELDSIFEETKKITYTMLFFEKIDLNKTTTALLANCCHAFDSLICREFIRECYNNGIPTVTIHDCFIVPVGYYWFATNLYNELYYNTYEKYNFLDTITIRYKNGKLEKLFNTETRILNEFWICYKEEILRSKYNLIFE